MLHAYLYPIGYAFLAFPAAAALFTVPFLVVQYRRHGYIHLYRALILYLLLLYLMNAAFLVLLPLPSSTHNEPPASETYFQWIPFHFLSDIVRETAVQADRPSTYVHLLKERAFLQTAFNVALTVPFGLFLRYYFRTRWKRCVLLSFGLSLLFETTQVTGIFGMYDYPYRLFDVDDLMTNTLGGLIGYLAAQWLSSRLPRLEGLDENVDLTKRSVTFTRRGLAWAIDWLLLLPAGAILLALRFPFAYPVLLLIYFAAIPYYTNGLTAGKWVVRIRLVGRGERLTASELLLRYGLLYFGVLGANVAYPAYAVRELPPALLILYAVGLFAMNATIAVHFVRRALTRRRRLFYESWSGTGHAIIAPAPGRRKNADNPAGSCIMEDDGNKKE